MPLYSYICKACGEKFDLLIGVSSENPELRCKKCGSEDIEKTFATFKVGDSGERSISSGPSCPTGTCPTCF